MEKSGENELANKDLLLAYGFKENKSLILDTYSIDISFNKLVLRELSVTLEFGNQYVHIREGMLDDDRIFDDVTVLLNGDYIRKKLTFKMIKDLYESLTLKELIKVE